MEARVTTLAWDGSTLASDSRLMDDAAIEPMTAKKIWRVNGRIIGVCGSYEEGLEFVRWFADGKPEDRKPKGMSDFRAIVVENNGKAYEYTERLVPVPCGKITAAGSGRAPALAAMMAGADAVKAVKIAARIDYATGGKVQKASLSRIDHPRKRR
jgi:hypothetical protein